MYRSLGQPPINLVFGLEKRNLSGLGGNVVDPQSHDTSRFRVYSNYCMSRVAVKHGFRNR